MTDKRTLLGSFAALLILALPALSAHATTYTFTPTFTDLTTPGNVTGTFGSGSSFNDPPTGTYLDSLNIVASDDSDGDELSLDFAFTAPGTGTASITGDADISGYRDSSGNIDWDSAFDTVTLSNGSVVSISVPNIYGYPFSTSLSSCGDRDRGCSCPSGDVCGSTDVTVTVWDNDPADPPEAPEPSSLALLGTGLVGAAGMIRRRLKA